MLSFCKALFAIGDDFFFFYHGKSSPVKGNMCVVLSKCFFSTRFRSDPRLSTGFVHPSFPPGWKHRTDGWLKMLKDLKKSHVMTAVEKEQSVWLGEFPFLIHVHTIARWWLQICVYFHSYLGKYFKFDYSI